jgi:hypothetical protein
MLKIISLLNLVNQNLSVLQYKTELHNQIKAHVSLKLAPLLRPPNMYIYFQKSI